MSKGQYRVGITFNPSNSLPVDVIKAKVAELIDVIDNIAPTGSNDRVVEVMRLKALAMTAFEEGAMWAVKAVTKPEPSR